MAIWHSSITRYRIRINTSAVVAEGLYHLWDTRLLDRCDEHSRVPRGTLVFGCDLNPEVQTQEGDVLLACDDFCRAYQHTPGECDFSLTDESPIEIRGGSNQDNLYDVATGHPVGEVFTEFYGSHYIKLKEGQYQLEPEEDGSAVTLVGLVTFENQSWLVGCASARDFNEVEGRLFDTCERTMMFEAAHAYHIGLSLETLRVKPQPADVFLRGLGDQPIQRLFLKERVKPDTLGIGIYVGGRRFVSFSEESQVDYAQLEAEHIERRAVFADDIQQLARRYGQG